MERSFILVYCYDKENLEKFNDFVINIMKFYLEPDKWSDEHYFIYKVYGLCPLL